MKPKKQGMWKHGIVLGTVLVLAGALSLFSSAAYGQTYLYNQATFPTGNNPGAMIARDFNGDGALDLAVVNQNDNTVSILLAKPNGGFEPKVDYSTGIGPVALVAADFNGDGKLDLALVGNQAGTVSVFLGVGDGTFQDRVDYPTGMRPVAIVAADFNGDKNIDLAVANAADNTVSILLGNGNGTFQSHADISVGGNPTALASGDFNGDGKPDVITANENTFDVSVLLGKGDGTFTRLDSSAGNNPSALVIGDFNSDGKLDAVVASAYGGPVALLLGKGDGTFANPVSIPVNFGVSLLAAADFNHDGKLDLALGGGSTISIMFGNGDGSFQQPLNTSLPVSATALLFADFNGDGQLDLAADQNCCSNSGSVFVLLGNGKGAFGSHADVSVPTFGGIGTSVVADFNGDGKPDLAVASPYYYPSGVSVSVVLGKGDGTFGAAISSPSGGASAMVSGDFNGDGKADLALLNSQYSPTLSTLLGNGDGTFQPAVDNSAPMNVIFQSFGAGDFDGDGKTDLAVTESIFNPSNYSYSYALQILLSNGDGTFRAGAQYALSTNSYGVYFPVIAADFNHDGKLDLVLMGSGLLVFIGKGDGTFTGPVAYALPQYPYSLAVADFHGSGNLDVAVGTYNGILVFPGNGDGTFQSAVSSNTNNGFYSLVGGDFNADGKLDVASNTFQGPAIFLGKGDGTFQPPETLGNSALAGAGDFNADGTADLVAIPNTCCGPLAVSFLLSTPAPSFYPSMLNFSSQGLGVASTAQTVSLANIGNGPLSITGAAASGDFAETNNCGSARVIAANCAFDVTFTPTAAGARNGGLTLTDNATSSPQVLALTGIGAAPVVSFSPASVTFASTGLGSTTDQTITLSNTGTAALNITSIGVSGDFSQANTCGASVAAGANCTITVTFKPTALGARTGTLTITDNASGSPQTVALAGTATGPVVSLSTATLPFAAQLTGATSAAHSVTLNNTGNGVLSISSIAASGDFGQTNTCGSSVAAGASCTISITFTPAAGGNRTGKLTITDNAADSPESVALSGVAEDFQITSNIGAETVTAGQSGGFGLSIQAAGGLTQSIAFSCSGAPSESTCTLSPASVTPSGSAASVVQVTLSTTAASMLGPRPRSSPPLTGGPNPYLTPSLVLVLMMLASLLWVTRRRAQRIATRWPLGVAMSFALLLLALTIPGCGGGGAVAQHNPGTPAGTYSLTVTGTVTSGSATLTHSVTLKVTVQ